ncbi:sigma-E processing peptidase SpoIIGA [Desulfolucanica intricata]|uniref:sigma-E processing peptidase SpoIIGA n=1 Tax=Desulfolucanica intricata TaxID=1285191 RepID=UPI0008352286|nr:sigma-E processing peptidase SpoIIGA [Desulfolucanica intricata]
MPTYVVYIDEVILGNLVMNYAILWLAARFCQIKTARWRLVIGAGLGSLYSLVLFFPQLNSLLSISFKFLISVLMVTFAYAPLPLKRFLKALSYFYLCSFVLGGVVFGCIYFLRNETGFTMNNFSKLVRDNFWYGVVLALLVAWLIGKGAVLARRRISQETYKIPLSVIFLGNSVEVSALIDTGNSLMDPLTQHPVVIIEYEAVKNLLPPEIQSLYQNGKTVDFNLIYQTLSGKEWANLFQVIPFHSLGSSNGLMLGFRPDEIITGQKQRVSQVVIGIYPGQLDVHASYRALLHPLVLDEYAA